MDGKNCKPGIKKSMAACIAKLRQMYPNKSDDEIRQMAVEKMRSKILADKSSEQEM